MKRKWFTLLFALLAVASFRVTAQIQTTPFDPRPDCKGGTYWWVKVDTTGLNGVKNPLAYSGNKQVQPNWFFFDQTTNPDSTKINPNDGKSLLAQGDKAFNVQYSVTSVLSGADNLLSFFPRLAPTTALNLSTTVNGVVTNWTQFEVVQFPAGTDANGNPLPTPNTGGWGYERATQALTTDGIEGYLMPAQGGKDQNGVVLKDSTASMLMVVADKNRNLAIKRFDEVFTAISVTSPIVDNNNVLWTTWPTYNYNNTDILALADAAGTGGVLNTTFPGLNLVGTQGTGFSRKVVYVSEKYFGSPAWTTGDLNGYTTEYIGTLPSNGPNSAAILDPANAATNWTNGLPLNYADPAGANLSMQTPNDVSDFGDSGLGVYAVVVQTDAAVNTNTVISGYTYNTSADMIAHQWRPVYIKLEAPAGRWATADDFKNGTFCFPNLAVHTAADLQARDRSTGAIPGDTYQKFTVTYADYISKNNDQSKANIFGGNASSATDESFATGDPYYLPKFDDAAGNGAMGTQALDANGNDTIIPLFILSSPDVSGCPVLSVSRENDNTIQTQAPGVYANKLELRSYGTYYDYFGGTANNTLEAHDAVSGAPWDAHDASTLAGKPVLDELRVATSLQKFAIWIDVCGNYTFYPVAAYSWIYGNDKRDQINTVSPNSVLLYNNTQITAAPGVVGQVDKTWGTQVGQWNGLNTQKSDEAPQNVGYQVTTAPNNLANNTDYNTIDASTGDCPTIGTGLEAGEWYFMEIQDDVATPTVASTGMGSYFRANAVQDASKTKYVLSVEVDPVTLTKKLVVLPEEKVRSYSDGTNYWYDLKAFKAIEQTVDGVTPQSALLKDYWSNNPYDLVNMSAHWKVTGSKDAGFTFVNMLGDKIEYNPATSTVNLAGGYLPVNSNIAGNPGCKPIFNNADHSQWFAPNSIGETGAQAVWTATESNGAFSLTLGDYTLQLGSTWYQSVNNKIGAKTDSTYYQKDITLKAPATPTFPYEEAPACPSSLSFKLTPIYYVPNYSGSYGKEDVTVNPPATINTNDPNFKEEGLMYQDSLTAYLYLDGTYGIKEAIVVGNGLYLGSATTDYLTVNQDARAASLVNPEGNNLQFIPITMTDRAAKIDAALNGATPAGSDIDKLYGETYKWFVVKNEDGKYLRFDTINPKAATEQLKVAFSFVDGNVENATPVRLYQPLVGDKLQGNFIFQFQLPVYTYDAANKKYYANHWPQIPNVCQNVVVGSNDPALNGGARVFGLLYGGQSNFILASGSPLEATRFTYDFQKPAPVDCCPQQYIDPEWMASEKLLNLPIENQMWNQLNGVDGGLGLYMATGGIDQTRKAEATVGETSTKVKFIYADSIRVVDNNGNALDHGVYSYTINNTSYTVATFATPALRTNGQGVVAVPLYKIMNSDGQYLTVSDTTYMFNTGNTVPDVTGVHLKWTSEVYANNADPKQNKAALQLFAISGNESSGPDENGWYTDCRPYVYLPLASYKADYTKATVTDKTIYYNNGLAIGGSQGCAPDGTPVNDVTQAFRVGYYYGNQTAAQRTQMNLAVLNAVGNIGASAVPTEWKWKKGTFSEIPCGDVLVKGDNGFYTRTIDNLCRADANTIIAHWQATNPGADKQLYHFAPEKLITTFDYKDADLAGAAQTQLVGDYYFQDPVTVEDTTTVTALNFSNYNAAGHYAVDSRTLTIICVAHTLPYYNLEPEYELPAQLAILESKMVDRNLSDRNVNFKYGPTPIWNDNSRIVYLDQNEGDVNKATYLTAYKTNVRRLAELTKDDVGHDIPYYAFSLTDPTTKKEYFLNVNQVDQRAGHVGKDSLYWTLDVDGSIAAQIKADYPGEGNIGGSQALSRYKFCLPYVVDGNGEKVAPVAYPAGQTETTYQPLYIQSMDTAITDYPYFVIVGAGSEVATVVRASNNVFSYPGVCNNTANFEDGQNIYSMDYAKIDPYQVTSWIFGGQMPSPTEWVPLSNTDGQSPYTNPELGPTELSTDGMITKYQLDEAGQGITFITNSKQQPVQYGLLSGQSNGSLHFVYEGTEQIGTYAKVPIYYYRIQSPDADGLYLTDSYNLTGADYNYDWNGLPYKYAYFDDTKLPASITDKLYDGTFTQTFGLRYVSVDKTTEDLTVADGSVPEQTFVVVANANYTKPEPNLYRYLAAANGRLTFVEGLQNAMAFQFGRANAEGGFTGVQVVGSGEIFGVTGGVKLLNQSGNIVNLYSVDGSLLKTVQVNGADQTVVAPRGVVIVKVADKATKVIVK